eukprot:CAMPEP_0196732952 /NCGR_PEP_ID=MMETSP1091-20130531/12197_1 /TAXON_ID=302021 /ORGANISM="Rhodomonas sp., Strain CCMP768" /LENGTH=257 /DNA_ID=CAMNT_0042076287 /DNA_START=59 /DNA_END=832 /DNA_ORIENTATION=-
MAGAPVTVNSMSAKALETHDGLFFKQTRRGWFQECFGCEAKTEFDIATIENKEHNVFYAIEDTDCCIRCICGPCRPFEMNLHEQNGDGPLMARFYRPLRCAAAPCKCCCFQELQVRDAQGNEAGATVETCYNCVPQYNILRPDGSVEYKLSQPTCCGGCCVNICAEGICNCRIPFYILAPEAGTGGKPTGRIVKVWSGLTNELFTDADHFEVAFPEGAGAESKARMVGALFLLNQLHFERSQAAHQHSDGGYEALHD